MGVQIDNLTKVFEEQVAVDAISFEVSEGTILGFLGPNGAGKSTTMKMITGYWEPTSGQILIDGKNVQEHLVESKRKIGYLPEHNPLYLDMYIKEYLAFVAGFYNVQGKQAKQRIEELIEMCGLQVEQHKQISQLSKGYRQRVGLAQALIHDPSVLILDEPTTGLDPNQIIEIRNLIKSVSKNKTVILSTHIMQEVQALCDQVVIINKGKIVANDRTANLVKSNSDSNLALSFGSAIDAQLLNNVDGVTKVSVLSETLVEIQIEESQLKKVRSEVYRLAGEHEWDLLEVKESQGSLEEVFHDLTIEKEA